MNIRAAMLLSASALFVAGCSAGGTTYGTGSSHEEATLKSMYNIFSLRSDQQQDIDYSARPGLVMPASKESLPLPDSSIEQSDGQAWPVTPEERIAAVRSAVPVENKKDGRYNDQFDETQPIEFLNKRDKAGIRNSAGLYGPSGEDTRKADDPDFIGKFMKENSGDSAHSEIAKRRGELAYSQGVERKFLTEPPVEYRTPAETAEAGDLGVDSKVIEERKKAARKSRINESRDAVDAKGAE